MPPLSRYLTSTYVSTREVVIKLLPLSQRTSMSCDGRSSVGKIIVNRSLPVSPRVETFSLGLNCNGTTPMPTRFDRWIRSKLSAMTTFTPCKNGPFAAQSREEPHPYSLPASTIVGIFYAWYFILASKINIFWLVGKWIVYGPVCPSPISLLLSLVLPKVPRTITSSLPLRAP